MYSARDQVEEAPQLDRLEAAADALDLSEEARSVATDLYLSAVPDADRSKPAGIAAALYAGALIAGDGRPQTDVADAVGVNRLVVQARWKALLESAGFEPPDW
jgi:transcription initiation factor TFIIIB Brf1 subunit/transcription initiation factor TFIIB